MPDRGTSTRAGERRAKRPKSKKRGRKGHRGEQRPKPSSSQLGKKK
jgi:hypothetical protein